MSASYREVCASCRFALRGHIAVLEELSLPVFAVDILTVVVSPGDVVEVWPSERAPLAFVEIDEVAIDPLALLLRNDVYVKLTLPDPPPLEVLRDQVRQAVRRMSPEERTRMGKRLDEFAQHSAMLKKELGR